MHVQLQLDLLLLLSDLVTQSGDAARLVVDCDGLLALLAGARAQVDPVDLSLQPPAFHFNGFFTRIAGAEGKLDLGYAVFGCPSPAEAGGFLLDVPGDQCGGSHATPSGCRVRAFEADLPGMPLQPDSGRLPAIVRLSYRRRGHQESLALPSRIAGLHAEQVLKYTVDQGAH